MDKKIEHIVIKYLNREYGDLAKHKPSENSYMLFFVRGRMTFMELKCRSQILLVDHSTIWSDLVNTFGLEENEIQNIIVKWLNHTYGMDLTRDDFVTSERGLLGYGEFVVT